MNFTLKPAAIILIIWATLTLFIDLNTWWSIETILIKLVAIIVLVHLADIEFGNYRNIKRDL